MNKELIKGLLKIAGQTAVTLFIGLLGITAIAGILGVIYNLINDGLAG